MKLKKKKSTSLISIEVHGLLGLEDKSPAAMNKLNSLHLFRILIYSFMHLFVNVATSCLSSVEQCV